MGACEDKTLRMHTYDEHHEDTSSPTPEEENAVSRSAARRAQEKEADRRAFSCAAVRSRLDYVESYTDEAKFDRWWRARKAAVDRVQ